MSGKKLIYASVKKLMEASIKKHMRRITVDTDQELKIFLMRGFWLFKIPKRLINIKPIIWMIFVVKITKRNKTTQISSLGKQTGVHAKILIGINNIIYNQQIKRNNPAYKIIPFKFLFIKNPSYSTFL